MKNRIMAGVLGCLAACVLTGCGEGESELLTLGDYTNLTYTPYEVEVTDGMVQERMDEILEEEAQLTEVQGRDTIAEGDIVNMDYIVTLDGEPLDDWSELDTDMEVGAMELHEDLDAALIGHKVGDSFAVPITYTEEELGEEDIVGKEVVYQFNIHKIQYYEVPKLTDAYAKEKGFDSVAAYRESLKEELTQEEISYAEEGVAEELLTQVINNSEFSINKKELKQAVKDAKSTYEQYAGMFGMKLEDFYQQMMGLEKDDVKAYLEDGARYQIEAVLVMDAIAQAEGIKITAEEFPEKAAQLAEEWEYESVEELQSDYSIEDLMHEMVNAEVTKVLRATAVEGEPAEETETEDDAETEDLEEPAEE